LCTRSSQLPYFVALFGGLIPLDIFHNEGRICAHRAVLALIASLQGPAIGRLYQSHLGKDHLVQRTTRRTWLLPLLERREYEENIRALVISVGCRALDSGIHSRSGWRSAVQGH